MGKKIISKRVRIPQYSPSDHTPEFFSDPFAGRLIPTAYFLKELDVLGPQNWMNMLSAEFVLRVVRNSAIHGEADSNDEMECCVDYYENEFSSGSSEDESDMEHDDRVNIDTYEHYSNQRRPQAYSQTHQILCIPTCSTSATMLPSPPASPMSTQTPYSPSPYSYFIPSPLPSPPLPSEDVFFCHTLILATQSGYFNRLLGPINSPTYTPYSKYASFLASPAPHSPDSQIFALPTINISVPHPSCFPPILHWLYNHDDDEWLDTMTLDNFGRVYENVVFLKLGREAYDVLDQFLEETEDAGIDYEIEGVLEEC